MRKRFRAAVLVGALGLAITASSAQATEGAGYSGEGWGPPAFVANVLAQQWSGLLRPLTWLGKWGPEIDPNGAPSEEEGAATTADPGSTSASASDPADG